MTTDDVQVRTAIAAAGRSLLGRGYAHGGAGNISVRTTGGILMTPTGTSPGAINPERLSLVMPEGVPVAVTPRPRKRRCTWRSMRRGRRRPRSFTCTPYSTALSCLADLDPADTMPPLTAYHVMRVGRLPLVGYHPSGDAGLAEEVAGLAADHHAMLLANHGTVAAGHDLADALAVAEEIEQTARLVLLGDASPDRSTPTRSRSSLVGDGSPVAQVMRGTPMPT